MMDVADEEDNGQENSFDPNSTSFLYGEQCKWAELTSTATPLPSRLARSSPSPQRPIERNLFTDAGDHFDAKVGAPNAAQRALKRRSPLRAARV